MLLPFYSIGQKYEHVKKYIDRVMPYAVLVQQKYNVPICITIGVAAMESGWGRSNVSKVHCNHLGLKGSKGYMSFGSDKEGFLYFGRLLGNSRRYKGLQYIRDYKTYCIELSCLGYNKREEYAPGLIQLIDQFNLNEL